MATLETATSTLAPIREKVEAGERLDLEDGLALLESDDLLGLGELADLARRHARRQRRGLLRPEPLPEPDERLPREMQVLRVRGDAEAGARVHDHDRGARRGRGAPARVDRRSPRSTWSTARTRTSTSSSTSSTIAALHEAMPDVHLKCYTASEIHHMTTLSGMTHEQVLRELQAAGLGSLPGGGAEVFADRVRQLVAPGKEHPEIWFHVHDTAHRLGIPTHCTMLYGHVETYEERVDHFLRLREQQDRTGGFLAFIPLAFHPENTVFERRGWRHTTGSDDLKMLAVSRLLLDNIPNIKAYWIMMGMPLAASRSISARTTCRARSCARRSSRPPARDPAPSRRSTSSSASLPRGGPGAGAARHALQRVTAAMGRWRESIRSGSDVDRLATCNFMAPVFYRLECTRWTSRSRRPDRAEPGCCSTARSTWRRSPRSPMPRNADQLRLLPRLCVSSEGAVDSIQLVTKLPLAPRSGPSRSRRRARRRSC